MVTHGQVKATEFCVHWLLSLGAGVGQSVVLTVFLNDDVKLLDNQCFNCFRPQGWQSFWSYSCGDRWESKGSAAAGALSWRNDGFG